jgi:predicted DNA-binding protein
MSTLSITVADETRNSLYELARSLGKTEQELVSEAIEKYIAIREFYRIRSRIIGSSGLEDLPSDEEIFEIVS